jgi:hypothetical protein
MKKILFFLLSLGIAGFASAQSSVKNTNATKVSKHSSKPKKAASKKSTAQTVELDNRKEYTQNGQKATPTGHDASPSNGEQFQSVKDSAAKKRKKQ